MEKISLAKYFALVWWITWQCGLLGRMPIYYMLRAHIHRPWYVCIEQVVSNRESHEKINVCLLSVNLLMVLSLSHSMLARSLFVCFSLCHKLIVAEIIVSLLDTIVCRTDWIVWREFILEKFMNFLMPMELDKNLWRFINVTNKWTNERTIERKRNKITILYELNDMELFPCSAQVTCERVISDFPCFFHTHTHKHTRNKYQCTLTKTICDTNRMHVLYERAHATHYYFHPSIENWTIQWDTQQLLSGIVHTQAQPD